MLLQLAVGVIVAYGGIVGVMYLTQRSLMHSRTISPASRRRRPAGGRGDHHYDYSCGHMQ